MNTYSGTIKTPVVKVQGKGSEWEWQVGSKCGLADSAKHAYTLASRALDSLLRTTNNAYEASVCFAVNSGACSTAPDYATIRQ